MEIKVGEVYKPLEYPFWIDFGNITIINIIKDIVYYQYNSRRVEYSQYISEFKPEKIHHLKGYNSKLYKVLNDAD